MPRQVVEGSREVSSINFYDAYGKFIRTLKVTTHTRPGPSAHTDSRYEDSAVGDGWVK